jgi:multimeric flavodoxin WrbA
MKVTVIYGTPHKGSTYNVVKKLTAALEGAEIIEYCLPKDMDKFCLGCFNCFLKGEDKCPHYLSVNPIIKSIEQSDVVILSSPCYVMNMSGELKALLDHLAYMWMAHRPHPSMFSKVGIVVTTTAGAGAGKTAKLIKQNMTFWGIPKVFTIAARVSAMGWEDVSDKTKAKIEGKISKTAAKAKSSVVKKKKPGITFRILYAIMKANQKGNNWNLTDREHWESNGWLQGKKPF